VTTPGGVLWTSSYSSATGSTDAAAAVVVGPDDTAFATGRKSAVMTTVAIRQ
jgi:hypothetical protein